VEFVRLGVFVSEADFARHHLFGLVSGVATVEGEINLVDFVLLLSHLRYLIISINGKIFILFLSMYKWQCENGK
jgi:hypothetical protein